jgi:phenylacetate-CoA ligase
MSPFEKVLALRGYDVTGALKEVQGVSALNRADLLQWQQQRRQALVEFHFQHNPLYRAKIGTSLPDAWHCLPVMGKPDFQSDLKAIVTNGMALSKLYHANTSGSSGHPFWFVKNRYAHACTWASIIQRYAAHGLSPSSKQARFYGIPLERWPQAKEKMKDRLMNRVRFCVFDLSDNVLGEYAESFTRIKFDYVYGYTNSLVLFARYLLSRNLCLKVLCPSLKACITTSEVCTPEDRDLLSRAFGARIINEYGASEVGLIAFENPVGEWALCEENLYIEVADDAGRPVPDGCPGYLLVTDLRNYALPFIRYMVGDIGVIQPDARPGENHQRKLLRLEGRVNDTIILPSGKRSPGLTFYYISRSMLESSGVLREFVIRQSAIDEFIFDIVSDRPLTAEEERNLQQKMNLYLEPGLKLRINRVPELVRPSSGKIKHFYSQLVREAS